MPKSSIYYYIVLIGCTLDIYNTLKKCKEQVNNYPSAYFKKSLTFEEAKQLFDNYQIKIKRKKKKLNSNNKIVIYTDDGSKEITEPLPGNLQTNNRAELYAVIRALETCKDQNKIIEIKSNSRYVVNSCETWIYIWIKNNWKTIHDHEVKNKDFFEKIYFLINKRSGKVYFTHIFGHKDINSNEYADRLAKCGAAIKMNNSKKLSLYNSFTKPKLPIIKQNNPDLDHKAAFKLVASM
ncbi:23397_t:CDS:2 [Cetraspora pellucida]|uniref:ribonuclease H n=1 Tax=Cetraspora pellucida TaxID=1433469 RepID=A0A9N9GBR1_9GLOM|nr:23397_t:CDS:2 [Cetraspora pellucida]